MKKHPKPDKPWEILRVLYRGNQGKNLLPRTRLEYAIRAYHDIFETEPVDFSLDHDGTFFGIATAIDEKIINAT